jgi:hypothetical protein
MEAISRSRKIQSERKMEKHSVVRTFSGFLLISSPLILGGISDGGGVSAIPGADLQRVCPET